MPVKIYHNPRCSKSRQTLEIIRNAGIEPQIIEYLKTPPTAAEIESLLTALALAPQEIMRRGEEIFKTLDLARPDISRAKLLAAIASHPVLIERPIVVTGKGARICRPPEIVHEIL